MRELIIVATLLVLTPPSSPGASQRRQIPITVTAQPASGTLKSGAPLLLRVVISNGLSQDIRFETFSLTPNSWNGEVTNISLVDIYRDAPQPVNIFYAKPKVGEMPKFIAGKGSSLIRPGEALSVLIDISKWQVNGGWKPGRYKITVRADNIHVDKYATASVMSDPVEIEIK